MNDKMYSRLKNTPTVRYRDQIIYGMWVRPPFLTTKLRPDQIGTLIVDNTLEGRPDKIAHYLYGSPQLDWILISFNNASDVLNWPRTNDIIKYPLDSVVIPQLLG